MQNTTQRMLSDRFMEALVFAFQIHQLQARKGSEIPYISHLLAVAALVLEDGGDEDETIAALLHDAAEDQGGLKTLEEIRLRFGERVAGIVDGCTDTYEDPKPAWQERKNAYLARLITASPSVLRVSTADKLHNARSLLFDLRRYGESDTWVRFNGGKEGTLWYYHRLLDVYQNFAATPLVEELAHVIQHIEDLVQKDSTDAGTMLRSNI